MKQIIILLAALLSIAANAQPEDKKERMEMIKAKKIAFISTELDLSPAEAEKFWPVYNEYDKKMVEYHVNRHNIHKAFKDLDALSDDEVFDKMKELIEIEKNEIALRSEYLTKFAGVLDKKKAAKVFIAEERFKKELLRMMKEQGIHSDKHDKQH